MIERLLKLIHAQEKWFEGMYWRITRGKDDAKR
jgi:hypothetical protein